MESQNFREMREMVVGTERAPWIEKQAAILKQLRIARIAQLVCGFIVGRIGKILGMSQREVALLKFQWPMQKKIREIPLDRAIEFSIFPDGQPHAQWHWHRREVGWTPAAVIKELHDRYLAVPDAEFGRTFWSVRIAKEKPVDSDEKRADGGTLADAVAAQATT